MIERIAVPRDHGQTIQFFQMLASKPKWKKTFLDGLLKQVGPTYLHLPDPVLHRRLPTRDYAEKNLAIAVGNDGSRIRTEQRIVAQPPQQNMRIEQ